MKNINELVNNFFENKNNQISMDDLVELVSEALDEEPSQLNEEQQKRFSVTIPIPRLTPSEAWGDPNSQSRQNIQKVFAVISGGQDISARIDSINKFLDVESAKRKRSPSVIINMMMIVESLQATLNDFNDSAAGFVFEGFMAALTGGKQEAGKVAGTLPIEDFVAFSEFGSDQPVSLKLLTGTTPVKGSFTNIVDFLLVRGAPAIKYLVAYKLTTGKDVVEKLNIFAFDITRENFVDFIAGSGGGEKLLAPVGKNKLKKLMDEFNSDPSKENLNALASIVVKLNGYTDKGLLNNYIKTGEMPTDPTGQDKEREEAEKYAKRQKVYKKIGGTVPDQVNEIYELLDSKLINENEAFHRIESLTMGEDVLLEGSGGKASQWESTFSQLNNMSGILNLTSYGELDLSQGNINALAEIYSDILGQELIALLQTTKELTENIGTYYSAKQRSKAQAAGSRAKNQTMEVKDILEGDPRYQK